MSDQATPLTREELATLSVCTVERAGATLGYGSRSASYQAAKDKRFPTIQLSPRRIVVPVPALCELLSLKPTPAGGS